jgi:exonuclease V gamma subunit
MSSSRNLPSLSSFASVWIEKAAVDANDAPATSPRREISPLPGVNLSDATSLSSHPVKFFEKDRIVPCHQKGFGAIWS